MKNIFNSIWLLLLSFTFIFNLSCTDFASKKISSIEVKGEYLCVSLSNLLVDLDNNKGIPEELKNLGGLSWLDGFVIDDNSSDIILFGKRDSKRPPYSIDDIFVNYQNIYNNQVHPLCSLDPLNENILKVNNLLGSDKFNNADLSTKRRLLTEAMGPQQVVVKGVPKNSTHGFVMIEADYHMKKVSQGLVKLNNIKSSIDLRKEAIQSKTQTISESNSSFNSSSRYWFNIKEKDMNNYPNFIESDNIVLLEDCPVVLLYKKQAHDSEGNLTDVNEGDPFSEKFAESFTNSFSELTKLVPIYAQLENLYRLHALLKALHYKRYVQKSNFQYSEKIINSSVLLEDELPLTKDGLANVEKFTTTFALENQNIMRTNTLMVCGGVSMNINVKENQFNLIHKESRTKVDKLKKEIIASHPLNNSTFWNVYIH